MKQIFNPPDWLLQWNRALAGETNDRFEQVVPRQHQKAYQYAETINQVLADARSDDVAAPTVAQLFYHLVREEVVTHTVQSQSMLRKLITTGLHWGLIDWDYISDVNMTVYDALQPQRVASGRHVEVWVEKPGFEAVLQPICLTYGLTWRVLRGRPTACDIYTFCNQMREYDRVHVVYLCDLDPVAEATLAFIHEQLESFDDQRVVIERAALTEQQIHELTLPANPVSVTAHGVQDYLDRYGTTQWELEALSPAELAKIVDDQLSVHLLG